MTSKDQWDWDTGKKTVADIGQWQEAYSYMEEAHAGPDGETLAAIVKNQDMEFTVALQKAGQEMTAWENGFDKVWNLTFGGDGRISALVSDVGEWTVATDDLAWENTFDFVWDLTISQDGKNLAVAAQKDLKYIAIKNDLPWENHFSRLTQMILSPDASCTAAIVETEQVLESEIFKFRKGCYSIGVEGKAWKTSFMNVWDPVFSKDSKHTAATIRTSYSDYTIAVNGKPWDSAFSSAWAPQFSPVDNSVTAPVKKGGKWFLAKDGAIFWDKPFAQLWHHVHAENYNSTGAIAAPEFGLWTVVLDGQPWEITFSEYVTDLVMGPQKGQAACTFKEKGRWGIAVNGLAWQDNYDMAWKPVFSPDGTMAAAKVEHKGLYQIVVNGKPLDGQYTRLANPIFSPDGKKLLIRGIEKETYIREVVEVA